MSKVPFATGPLEGSFLGKPFTGKHAIGYPSEDGGFTVAVWDVPVTCDKRTPSGGRFVRVTFDKRKKGPRGPLPGLNPVMVGDTGASTQGGVSSPLSAELVTDPAKAKKGEARLVVDFTHPAMTVKLNGTIAFDVCKCTAKDCL